MIYLDTTPSTNSAARQLLAEQPLAHGSVVYTHRQTAGRGQRGNTWEAESGANVTMSLVLRPEWVKAAEQFFISEAVALGVASVVEESLSGCDHEGVTVKWPNDIYVGDRKVAGILIENSLQGASIETSIAGIGLNVNQREFHSDAPNPVSLWQISSRRYDIEDLIKRITAKILAYLELPFTDLHLMYKSHLWRHDDRYHPFRSADRGIFQGRIIDVEPTGHLVLSIANSLPASFAFKEVTPIL